MTGELAREVLADVDAKAVVVALATVAAGAIDVAARATSAPFDLTLQRLLGAIPGPQPGTDPDLGL
jgi:type IV secretory pathway VirB2 component (pilin)